MPNSSTFNPAVVRDRLGMDHLRSYLEDCGSDVETALVLHAWNAQIAAAFLEDLGRLEVVIRNRFDEALTELLASAGLTRPWFDHGPLFPGRGGNRARQAIEEAKRRVAHGGGLPVHHGRVISQLSFGFWRFLCAPRHLTSLWGPALASLFPHHPASDNAVQIRADVELRMDRLHFLRNRVAHHEPVHRRRLADDADHILKLVEWMCVDTHEWITHLSRVPTVLASRPPGTRLPNPMER